MIPHANITARPLSLAPLVYVGDYTNDVAGATGTSAAINYTGLEETVCFGWLPFAGGSVITIR